MSHEIIFVDDEDINNTIEDLIDKLDLISSENHTKEWRNSQEWYYGGKKNECEKHQLSNITKIIGECPSKTIERFDENLSLVFNAKPYTENDGFEYTENFDGKIIMNNKKYYFNLKFIVGGGGAQTRSVKLAYDFIKTQYEYLKKTNKRDTYFINILDGDECFRAFDKFKYLANKYNNDICVFIGDTYDFCRWWIKNL